MKLNRIISSALVLVMLLTSIITTFSVSVMASDYADSVTVEMGVVDEDRNEKDALKDMIERYANNNYSTAAEMLAAEIASAELDKVSAAGYNLYVNRYSGFVFYENTMTGQILTSNPIDPAYSGSALDASKYLMSQIELEYSDLSNPSVEGSGVYYSASEMEQGFGIKVSEVSRDDGARGISVQYTLGINAADFRVPGYILAEDFVEHIGKPALNQLAKFMEAACGEGTIEYNLNNDPDLLKGNKYYNSRVIDAIDSLGVYAADVLGRKSEAYKALAKHIDSANLIFEYYSYIDPDTLDKTMNKVLFDEVPVLNEGKDVYRMTAVGGSLTFYQLVNGAMADLLGPLYTNVNSTADCEKTGYIEKNSVNSASFLVSINYYLDRNGELSFEVPMSAPYFVNNNPNYTVQSITPLKYFGAGDLNSDGYIFFPDGSGSIIEFEKIRGFNPYYSIPVYGNDYGYASLDVSKAHLEPAVMPVYGMVNEVPANASTEKKTGEPTITNGYFSIIDNGASLSTLAFSAESGVHKYVSTYASYTPQPTDKCDLSDTISVSGIGFYYVVSESVYDGVYSTRVTMLTDESLQSPVKAYAPTYLGMAERYRDYLINEGVISKLSESETSRELPIYIEILGAMDVTQKILSFPVVVSTPLTTFDQVGTIYSELAGAGVKNINFRLSGFANGGLASTYPVKVTWENSLGGDKGADKLVETAAAVGNKDKTANFGLYPDFDFLYIHNEEMFDGISYVGTTAIMVDNRYASKQSFNAVLQLYESMFSLVISPNQYDSLYTKFEKEYSKYGFKGLSVATLGSELNSNFDKDNAIHREDSLSAVKRLFGRMSSKYSVMTDVGNAYALEYADHILNAPIDSSHYKYSSYTVPFYGMVLHGYVNYAGSPINYSGFSDYDILRSIESGATLQYILCYQNTNYLKDDPQFSKYYGVDYKNWKNIIVSQYETIKAAIGSLQSYTISNHQTLVGERVIEKGEVVANYKNLIDEYISYAETQFEEIVADKAAEIRRDPTVTYTGLTVRIEKQSVIDAMIMALGLREADARAEMLSVDEAAAFNVQTDIKVSLYSVIEKYAEALIKGFADSYPEAEGSLEIDLSAKDVDYTSRYDYRTESMSTDKKYDSTDYTCDNDNIVMVTYTDDKTGDEVIFFINYNVYDVKIRVDADLHEGLAELIDDFGYITLGASNFIKIQ